MLSPPDDFLDWRDRRCCGTPPQKAERHWPTKTDDQTFDLVGRDLLELSAHRRIHLFRRRKLNVRDLRVRRTSRWSACDVSAGEPETADSVAGLTGFELPEDDSSNSRSTVGERTGDVSYHQANSSEISVRCPNAIWRFESCQPSHAVGLCGGQSTFCDPHHSYLSGMPIASA